MLLLLLQQQLLSFLPLHCLLFLELVLVLVQFIFVLVLLPFQLALELVNLKEQVLSLLVINVALEVVQRILLKLVQTLTLQLSLSLLRLSIDESNSGEAESGDHEHNSRSSNSGSDENSGIGSGNTKTPQTTKIHANIKYDNKSSEDRIRATKPTPITPQSAPRLRLRTHLTGSPNRRKRLDGYGYGYGYAQQGDWQDLLNVKYRRHRDNPRLHLGGGDETEQIEQGMVR